jgi:ABC-type nickel/cobalt efflux system permease component RcnA
MHPDGTSRTPDPPAHKAQHHDAQHHEAQASAPPAHRTAPASPDDHRKFSLSEDWLATVAGLLLFAACMAGLLTPEMLP